MNILLLLCGVPTCTKLTIAVSSPWIKCSFITDGKGVGVTTNYTCYHNSLEIKLKIVNGKLIINIHLYCLIKKYNRFLFVRQKAFIPTFHTLHINNLCDFTTQKPKFRRLYYTENPVLNADLKISDIQI